MTDASITMPIDRDYPEIRDSVRRICEGFPGEYWRGLDTRQEYPTDFVAALTEAGYLAVLIPETVELHAAMYRRVVLDISGARILTSQRRLSNRDHRAQRSTGKISRVSCRAGSRGSADLLSTSRKCAVLYSALAYYYCDSSAHRTRANVSDFCPIRDVP